MVLYISVQFYFCNKDMLGDFNFLDVQISPTHLDVQNINQHIFT